MQKILDAFQYLFELLSIALDFMTTFMDSFQDFLKMIPSCLEMLISVIAYLPPELMVFATLSVSISVIFLVVGRGRTN